MKKFFAGFMLAVLLLATTASALPSPTSAFYVADDADVIEPNTENYILEHSLRLFSETGAQIVVATTSSLDGQEIRDFGISLARKWKIGTEGKDNGILILFAEQDRKITVEVGRGLEGALNDAKVGRILDQTAIPFFRSNEFDEGLSRLYQALLAETYREYGQEVPDDVTEPKEERGNSRFIAIVITTLFIFLLFRVFRGPRGGGGRPCYLLMPFLRPGGGFGGGFGGGGGGFGAGGGFGGGGASRGF